MHGNVYEWCHAVSEFYPSGGAATDPPRPILGLERVVRGGSFSNVAAHCRAAARTSGPMVRSGSYGFRVALSPSVKSPKAEHNK